MIMEKKKRILDYMLLTVRKTGAYFMAITMIIVIVSAIINSDQILSVGYFKFILLTSFIFALASYVFKIKKIKSIVFKVFIHYVITALAFVLILCLWSGASPDSKNALILLIVYSFIYFVIAGIYALVKAIGKSKENKGKQYSMQFGMKDKTNNE